MKTNTSILLFAALLGGLSISPAKAATPEQEKAFVASYKKALEAGDAKTLASFLSTEGADADVVEMFKMMQTIETGAKITSIELVTLEKADKEKMGKALAMPNGKSYKLPVAPYKKLVIKTETKTDSSNSTGSSESPVAEIKGKLVIPVPVVVKK
jgi:hypothetical protein